MRNSILQHIACKDMCIRVNLDMSKCNDLMSSLNYKRIWKKDSYVSQHFCTFHAKQLKKYLHHKPRKKAKQRMRYK